MKIPSLILIMLVAAGVVYAANVVTKIDDNTIQVSSTVSYNRTVPVSQLLSQQASYQNQVDQAQVLVDNAQAALDRADAQLNSINDQLQQASNLGVASATTALQAEQAPTPAQQLNSTSTQVNTVQ